MQLRVIINTRIAGADSAVNCGRPMTVSQQQKWVNRKVQGAQDQIARRPNRSAVPLHTELGQAGRAGACVRRHPIPGRRVTTQLSLWGRAVLDRRPLAAPPLEGRDSASLFSPTPERRPVPNSGTGHPTVSRLRALGQFPGRSAAPHRVGLQVFGDPRQPR